MRLRSLLFVPGDRPDRMQKALASGADALILDLEDAVAPARKDEARLAAAAFLTSTDRSIPIFVRINQLGSHAATVDLAAIVPTRPDAIVLPKSEGGASLARLDELLCGFEASDGVAPGEIDILPIATETPAAVFGLGTYAHVSPRLLGLTWGAEDLPAAIGAATSRDEAGNFTPPYEIARALTLLGAAAAEVPAIETVFPAFADLTGLAVYASRARRDGFAGMLAIHPCQIPVINAAFSPSDAEVEGARAIVAAFATNPDAGVLSVGGRMVDRPHLVQAQKLLRFAEN